MLGSIGDVKRIGIRHVEDYHSAGSQRSVVGYGHGRNPRHVVRRRRRVDFEAAGAALLPNHQTYDLLAVPLLSERIQSRPRTDIDRAGVKQVDINGVARSDRGLITPRPVCLVRLRTRFENFGNEVSSVAVRRPLADIENVFDFGIDFDVDRRCRFARSHWSYPVSVFRLTDRAISLS